MVRNNFYKIKYLRLIAWRENENLRFRSQIVERIRKRKFPLQENTSIPITRFTKENRYSSCISGPTYLRSQFKLRIENKSKYRRFLFLNLYDLVFQLQRITVQQFTIFPPPNKRLIILILGLRSPYNIFKL